MIKTKAIMKNKHKAASAVLAVVLLTCSFTACNQKREFGEGVYHMESDPNVTITITDVVDTPGNEDHEKTCKVQFSENFDFSKLEEDTINTIVGNKIYLNNDRIKDMDEKEIEKEHEECRKVFEEKINYKMQFADKPCTFSFSTVHNDDESYSMLLADVEGGEGFFPDGSAYCFQIVVDENGRLIVDGDTEKAFV